MIIKISNLSEGTHELVFEDKISNINLSDPFYGSFKSFVILNKLHDQFILSVNSIFKAKFECDRCANEYKTKITSDYKMVYLMNEEPIETSSLNVNYLRKDAVQIDLTNDVREFALLSVPMKKLCAEDCKGLCPKCGTDLNSNKCNCTENEVDPRWKPLIDLKEKLNLN